MLAAPLRRPVQRQRQVDRRHRQNALEPVDSRWPSRRIFPRGGSTSALRRPVPGRMLAALGRLPLGRRFTRLLERDGHGLGVVSEWDAGETISIFANKNILCSSARANRVETLPKRRLSVSTVSRPAPRVKTTASLTAFSIGADNPAIEMGDGVDQGDLADVVRLSGLARDRKQRFHWYGPWPRPRPHTGTPARGRGTRTSRSCWSRTSARSSTAPDAV